MPTYDYNTGKPLAPGQAQSAYSATTGLPIGYGNTSPSKSSPVTTNNIPSQYQTPELMAYVNNLAQSSIAKGGATSAKDIGTPALNIPPPPVQPNLTGLITGGNASVSPTGLTNPDGTIAIEAEKVDGKPKEKTLAETVKETLSLYKEPENQADIYNKLEAEAGIAQKQQAVRSYTSQINAITAKAQADQLSLIGQGRGVPEVIIGGQQAQVAKEAAIQVLPIQAQLSAAQGDLEMAQAHVDKLFKIYSEDSRAKTDHWNKIVSVSYEIFSRAEQRRLDEIAAEKKAQGDALQRAIDYQRELSKSALSNGQSSLFSQISAVQPPVVGSATYAQDLAKYNETIAKLGGGLKDIGFLVAQANIAQSRASMAASYASAANSNANAAKTRAETAALGTGGLGGSQDTLGQIGFLRKTAQDAKNLSRAAGVSGVGKKVGDLLKGDTEFRQLEALTNTLRTNVLTLATDPSIRKYFGPQMSNNDVALLLSSGTTLDPEKNSPRQLKAEIQRLDNLFMKLETVAKNNAGISSNVQIAPTGEQIIITD